MSMSEDREEVRARRAPQTPTDPARLLRRSARRREKVPTSGGSTLHLLVLSSTVEDLLIRGYDRVIVSPGPCTPHDAGISLEAVRRFPQAGIPTLGVCLGHQAMVQAWGGRVVTHRPVHGKTTMIEHDGRN